MTMGRTKLEHDIEIALDDDMLHDVVLLGADEIAVPANKMCLAVRSPVFRSMFFGEGHFRERNAEQVDLPYPGDVLRFVAKYCYTDEVDWNIIFTSVDSSSNNSKTSNKDNTERTTHLHGLSGAEAVAFVQLRDAANYTTS